VSEWVIRVLDSPEAMLTVEALQRLVWTGNETEVVPAHMLLAAVHNGGIIIGAFRAGSFPPHMEAVLSDVADWKTSPADTPADLIGFVFGFPGFYFTPDGPRLKHCSHMLGVQPTARSHGVGFLLKRAQWQLVRRQGLDRITWTYDPLLGLNAHLNIARLGAVCNTYLRNEYGELRDNLNLGLPTDRFQVDWWINTARVERRLSKQSRLPLDMAHLLEAGAEIINPTRLGSDDLPQPSTHIESINYPIQLVEIPANFQTLRSLDSALALEWRLHTRAIFEELFGRGYQVTDFIHLDGNSPRSFYVVIYGESTL
jgi:predicted GNAT superfamily acetyltransferase